MDRYVRHSLLLLAALGSLAAVMSLPPVFQDPAYHSFADQRAFFGVPRFLDIVTNLPFLIIGIAGLRLCLQDQARGARRYWVVLFAGVALVGIGSAFYHAVPNDMSLVWDRLPMTVGFMGVLVAVIAERISERIATLALLPAICAGMLSVLWWVVFGDLRPYIWVQVLPFIVIPMTLLLYSGSKSGAGLIILSLSWYVLAKAAEHFDLYIFTATGQAVSGHSLKHLAAAAGCAVLLFVIRTSSTRIMSQSSERCQEASLSTQPHKEDLP